MFRIQRKVTDRYILSQESPGVSLFREPNRSKCTDPSHRYVYVSYTHIFTHRQCAIYPVFTI